ncbi:winged helix-turn-helix domain-containing protein [Paramaledivibacter caminithermalis]|jgi:DNA-binding transcriptional ArsR family regulator|uniref:Helix-turn-helix domain-containing protein n=1 Tax=Paramaledivibacter caminithermalis (strain DSM 15212 / CIP 107654 / DViRD3) TaxID=1121301 RepID=A0A1M6MMV0_PARC5|nr:helix-turn-helix domain-containing protein [Paramaledivibacter caminithermalis]SHJ84710.1 Helix-turn-helix domain-containing protein [Paramaledivibacter caminithermalis DSM 15212]
MKDILVLRELEQIKAIAHPYRLEIIESFEESSATAKQIADKMQEPHAKVNYHIKTLVKVGILELVEEKVKLGIVEKYYMPSARNFVIDRNILNTSEKSVLESLAQASISLFENISKDFYRAVEHTNEKEYPKKFLYYNDYYLTLEEINQLQSKLESVLIEFLEGKKDKNRPNTKRYTISSLMIPRVKDKK